MHGVNLILKRHGFHALVNRTIPFRPAAGGAATVGNHDDVPLIGPPLRIPVERLAFDDLLESRAAVWLHEYRQPVSMRVPAALGRQHDRRV